MQTFKTFFKIAWRRLPSIILYFIIYAIITFALGNISQTDFDSNFKSKELDICVIDEDNSTTSKALVNYLDSMHNLVHLENNAEVLQDNLYYRYISYVLTIPEGFENNLIDGKTKELLTDVKLPNSTSGYYIDQQTNQFLNSIQVYIAGGYSLDKAISETNENIKNCSNVETIEFDDANNSKNSQVFYFYQYLPYIFIVILLCGLAPIIIIFNKKEIQERISCSALSHNNKNLQLALCCSIYSFVVWIAYIFMAFVAYGSKIFETNSLYAMLNSFVFILIASGITFFASNYSLDNNVLNMIANTVGLSMAFLCGVFVPQNMLSSSVLSIGKFLPAYWYIKNNNMLAGFSNELFSIKSYWTSIGIQILFAAAIFSLALVASKLRRQKTAN